MKETVLVVVSLVVATGSALAQNGVVQINQASVAATAANRSTGGFPYQITQPGSYQLTGNLVVPANVDGIDIQSNNVTLDLNGFTISGGVTCPGSVCTAAPNGIVSSFANVTVRNGSVVGFFNGVFLGGLNNLGNLVEDIHASGNINLGIAVANGVVRRNTANLNGAGINVASSTVTENVANFNSNVGLVTTLGGVFGSNTFQGNGHGPVTNSGSVSQNNNACNGTLC
jgi:hypothetical protein